MSAAVSYVDYSVFNSDKFDARQYANSLLLSTTDRDELLIDFSSAQNKLRFDLEEIDAAVKQEIGLSWEELLERTELASSTTEDVSALDHGLKDLSITYEKLAAKTVEPYDKAEPLYDALINLTGTSTLLRSLKVYLRHVSQLFETQGVSDITDALVDLDRCVQDSKALMQLRIVISTLSRVDSKRLEASRYCTTGIETDENLELSLANLLRLDRPLLLRTIRAKLDDALKDGTRFIKAGLEVDYALKRLQSTDAQKASVVLEQNLRHAFDRLGAISRSLQKFEDACSLQLLQVVLDDLCDSSASIKQYFWREISGRISNLTRDAIRVNQWIYRALKAADIDSIVVRGLQKGTMEYSVVYGSLSRR